MHSTHTPGPYTVHHDEDTNRFQVFQDTGRGFGPMLAEIVGVRGSFEANARLFAAGPELLAACERAYDALNELLGAEYDVAGDLALLRAAITKARGD